MLQKLHPRPLPPPADSMEFHGPRNPIPAHQGFFGSEKRQFLQYRPCFAQSLSTPQICAPQQDQPLPAGSSTSRPSLTKSFLSVTCLSLEHKEGAEFLWLQRNNFQIKPVLGVGQEFTHPGLQHKQPTFKGWGMKKTLKLRLK